MMNGEVAEKCITGWKRRAEQAESTLARLIQRGRHLEICVNRVRRAVADVGLSLYPEGCDLQAAVYLCEKELAELDVGRYLTEADVAAPEDSSPAAPDPSEASPSKSSTDPAPPGSSPEPQH